MARFLSSVRSLGARPATQSTAPTQPLQRPKAEERVGSREITPNVYFNELPKQRWLDRWLDRVVQASGSQSVFFFILAALVTWALLGIPFGTEEDWQVCISDVQAIFGYVFDSLLMRQQFTNHRKMLGAIATLKSRQVSHLRMLRTLAAKERESKALAVSAYAVIEGDTSCELAAESWLDRISNYASFIIGHLVTTVLFWVGIAVWLAFGPSLGWSNEWQLYINSATSALMVFIFAFLANIRERQCKHSGRALDSIFEVDASLERALREATTDTEKNRVASVAVPKANKVQRVIDFYAELIGSLIGIVLLLCFIVAWAAIGPALQFSSSWWLLLGTYAGLIGLFDSFVLRNVAYEQSVAEQAALEDFGMQDGALFTAAGLPPPNDQQRQTPSFTERLSLKMGFICSHWIMVILGLLLVIGLIIGSSVMRWSLTGQLLSNIPPSIVESWFMMILVTGHHIADVQLRVDFQSFYLHRLTLKRYVDGVGQIEKKTAVAEDVQEIKA